MYASDTINDFSHLYVRFYVNEEPDKKASAKLGRPVTKFVEMIEIRTQGDPKSVGHHYAHHPSTHRDANGRPLTYAQVHHGPYEAWKKQQDQTEVQGTLLKEMGVLSREKIADLNRNNIYTVEALAALDGSMLQKLGMNARDMKVKAQAYLDRTAGNADFMRMASENEALRNQQEELTRRLVEMEKALQRVSDTPPPPPPAPAIEELVEDESDPGESASDPGESAGLFDDWDEATLRAYLFDNGNQSPPANAKIETLRRKAELLNEQMKEEKAA